MSQNLSSNIHQSQTDTVKLKPSTPVAKHAAASVGAAHISAGLHCSIYDSGGGVDRMVLDEEGKQSLKVVFLLTKMLTDYEKELDFR